LENRQALSSFYHVTGSRDADVFEISWNYDNGAFVVARTTDYLRDSHRQAFPIPVGADLLIDAFEGDDIIRLRLDGMPTATGRQVHILGGADMDTVESSTSNVERWRLTGPLEAFSTTVHAWDIDQLKYVNYVEIDPGVSFLGPILSSYRDSTLSYAAWTTGVRVDLAAGTATGLPNGVQGFVNVTGGSGPDVLKGDDFNNLLRGGGGADILVGRVGADALLGGDGEDRLFGEIGNDLLIGGRGSDTLDGGGGLDILIGGTTSHDYDDLALRAIMDLSVSHLRVDWSQFNTWLQVSTVQSDRAPDRLTGGAGSSWFWVEPDLTIASSGQTRSVPLDLILDFREGVDSMMVDS
jgi:Ca2+-binding RTX toxin-like protein